VKNGFDLAQWQMNHTELLNQTKKELKEQGHDVLIENQNYFNLEGTSATLAGKPDLVTVNGSEGLVVDVKTGQESASDQIQVLIYMYALPKAFSQYRDVTFQGKVVYKDHEVLIPSDAVNDDFIRRLSSLIRTIATDPAPMSTPSFLECKFCDITSENCPDRVDEEPDSTNEDVDF